MSSTRNIASFYCNLQANSFLILCLLLPLYCCRWFTCNIVDDAVNVVHFVYDTNRDFFFFFSRETSEVCGHAVD